MDWAIGQRVCREEAPERAGTVAVASRVEIKVVWDDGGMSFYELGSYIPLRYAREK
jgi:hypothetical protein